MTRLISMICCRVQIHPDHLLLFQDMWKVVWSMHEIMRSDPLRRFAHGITIEDTMLRFWISHRAYLVASTPIDISPVGPLLSHPPTPLMPLLFPEPHQTCPYISRNLALQDGSVGIRSTMSRVPSRDGNRKYCYDITVCDYSGKERIFHTKVEISMRGADAMRGRGTRVWSVYDKMDDPEGKTLFALKDAWVNTDRPREGNTLRTLRGRLTEKGKVDALKHFLTEVTCGDVHIGRTPDSTGTRIQNGKLFTVNSIIQTSVALDEVGTDADRAGA
jgi:Fungal protein kinase